MKDRNPFGGNNPNSLYTPMSDVEREFLDRLKSSGDLRVMIHGWGHIDSPTVYMGESQVAVSIDITFGAPLVAIPVSVLDLELCTHSGISLFREAQPTEYGGQPLMIGAGIRVQMMWHIGIHAIDENLIRSMMPGAKGMTSRNRDKDTGSLTTLGNMHLGSVDQKLLGILRQGEASVRNAQKKTVAHLRGKR